MACNGDGYDFLTLLEARIHGICKFNISVKKVEYLILVHTRMRHILNDIRFTAD